MNRNLDGYYFRVKREGKWENVCFSDMTEDERKEVIDNKDIEWVKSLCLGLARTISNIGELLDIEEKVNE